MFSGLISIAVAFWFYRTANAKSAPALQWAGVGFITYLLPNLIWTFTLTKPLVKSLHTQNAGFSATLVSHSGILVGVTVAVFVWYAVLDKLKTDPRREE
ncbi:hypothetical protein F6R98_00525 [Candidatus Methylospira mobilis]|uniref:Uncharacterized protein n=1 Tax=Candidatus Methylospira mobilis TaxID=1808979 RepID=A0A5Q0BHI4_9GAMM|nr:hypothetical protein [Candidatus Methylospira mobilis]QFY41286.1 hypothetical protein F6R98_00525 [Candidatus Methylospira mobilis]WNV05492.1 hypothetical protein RP726_03520 [Candidatus Methylospira mobilis]